MTKEGEERRFWNTAERRGPQSDFPGGQPSKKKHINMDENATAHHSNFKAIPELRSTPRAKKKRKIKEKSPWFSSTLKNKIPTKSQGS